jgi:hypothetical protein
MKKGISKNKVFAGIAKLSKSTYDPNSGLGIKKSKNINGL